MVKKTLLTVLILLILVAGTALAEPDSLWIGQQYALYVGDGVF